MSFGSYTSRTYNINLNNNYSYSGLGSFGLYTNRRSYGIGNYGYYGGETNYNRYSGCWTPTTILGTALTNQTNWGSTLYADLDSPTGISSINPFVDYSINRPYMGGGFTGFSLISSLTGGWVGPMGFNAGMIWA